MDGIDKLSAQLEMACDRIAALERRVELLRVSNNHVIKKAVEMERQMADVEHALRDFGNATARFAYYGQNSIAQAQQVSSWVVDKQQPSTSASQTQHE